VCSALGPPLPPASTTVWSWWRRMRVGLQSSQRKGLDSLFALVSWQLWKERNARCFRESASPVTELMQVIKAQAEMWVQAGAKHLGSLASGGQATTCRVHRSCCNTVAIHVPVFGHSLCTCILLTPFLMQWYALSCIFEKKSTSLD
jgi:hypothetical protein